ncbi:hypothetical protein GCM10010123_22660 [Pilimelia anulata]|uniref:Uncharacterized protein n=1 Tax=Pilimelia anulata TaxID=53371 RepID=A0A8J3BA55_9ACTN|nr:hypothetical protein GCM10010123_22660 [Pilimelia anulata]
MQHCPRHLWWVPWRRIGTYGCRWYPCPDAAPPQWPPGRRSLGLEWDADTRREWR